MNDFPVYFKTLGVHFKTRIYHRLISPAINRLSSFDETPCYSVVNDVPSQNRLQATVNPAITIATMLISLIRIFRLGPDVSLNGSPTVSPTTAAL